MLNNWSFKKLLKDNSVDLSGWLLVFVVDCIFWEMSLGFMMIELGWLLLLFFFVGEV